jgi:hypothetical protein
MSTDAGSNDPSQKFDLGNDGSLKNTAQNICLGSSDRSGPASQVWNTANRIAISLFTLFVTPLVLHSVDSRMRSPNSILLATTWPKTLHVLLTPPWNPRSFLSSTRHARTLAFIGGINASPLTATAAAENKQLTDSH